MHNKSIKTLIHINTSSLKTPALFSQTLLHEHLINVETSLLQTVCFVSGERTPLNVVYILKWSVPYVKSY